jgi:hypothetical protein
MAKKRPKVSKSFEKRLRELEADADKRLEREVDAIVQSELMEETAAYLSRGRPHASLTAQEAGQQWVAAYTRWFAERTAERQREWDDLAAELRLRGLEPPYDTVRPILERMREEIRAIGLDDPALHEKIEKYLQAREKPSG